MAGELFLKNAGSAILSSGVTSFGKVFAAGEMQAGQSLTGVINEQACAVHVDVKSTYADGSAKMVIVITERSSLAAGEIAAVPLTAVTAGTAASLDFRAGLVQHDFTVEMTAANGQTTHNDVLAALGVSLARGDASFWQAGKLAVQARVDIPIAGSQRMISTSRCSRHPSGPGGGNP